MKISFNNPKNVFLSIGLSFFLMACEQEKLGNSPFVGPEEPDDTEEPAINENPNEIKESTVLIYAVATNSLGSNLIDDKNEMLLAAENIDLSKNNVLIFETRFEKYYDYSSEPIINLIKLIKKGDSYDWNLEKEYTTEKASLDPEQISEIISYVTNTYPAENNGLIFWSHSTASNPYFPATKSEGGTTDLPMQYSFGDDKIYSNGEDFCQINVDDLATAIPDGLFDFIWFDSCYMSNIETIYQFRNKSDFFIGAPTEVPAPGMPYHYTLPLLVGSEPDYAEAAKLFFNYYNEEYSGVPATIAVIDLNNLNILSDYCKEIYTGYKDAPSTSYMLKYTNNSTPSYGPFYDLGDFTKEVASEKGLEITAEEWQDLISQLVIYKAATATDYNRNRIDKEKYSGISTYIYRPEDNSLKEAYFESLDWFNEVFSSDSEETEEIEEGMNSEDPKEMD